jgi:transposase InsO family protein
MKALSTKGYTVTDLCVLIGISRQGYYKQITKQCDEIEQYSKLEDIVICEREIKSRAGLRAIYHKQNLSALLGVNRFEQIMSQRGYALKPHKSFIKTTDSRGHQHKYGNLISGKEVNGANQVISGDITYYQSGVGLFYIFSFTDLYTLEIKGISASRNMQGIHAERCLRQVLKYNNKKTYKGKLIVHTDGGGQYRSDAYQLILRKAEILPSQAKSCLENGLAERFNGIIKNDYLIDFNIKSEKQLNRILKQIQKDHNQKWPSSKLGWKTPCQYAEWVKKIPLKQRPVIKVKPLKE